MSEIVVIYDGQCEFCKQTVKWISKKLTIEPIAYQSADLSKLGLSYQECEKSVHVIFNGEKYKSAKAVAILLKLRGNKLFALLVNSSGIFGNYAYYWVARNRSKAVVKILTKLIFR